MPALSRSAAVWMVLVCLAFVFAPLRTSAQNLPALPQTFIDTTYNPPTGNTITVNAGGNLQTALNSAQPGDIIQLQAGATFTGNFVLPNKGAGTNWIYIRSSAHASLPAPGNRVFPSHAALMPKIQTSNTEPAIVAAFGAHHYRFVGIEITSTAATGNVTLFGIDSNGNHATTLAQLPKNITIDRCYVHGTNTLNILRGAWLNGETMAVIDSYFSNFHSTGQDSQTILISQGGPFKIVNNYLEAAGENTMFGGADPTITNNVPSDIEIRGNHYFKPLSWQGSFVVKNLFELKNARRVLVEGNVFENIWSAAQAGFAFQLTVRNEEGTAPWSTVVDVTIRKNIMRNFAQGVNTHGTDDNATSQPGRRFHIHDNVFETMPGGGRLLQVLNDTRDVTFEHNTAFQTGPIIFADPAPSPNLTFRNNITAENQGVIGSGTGRGTPTLNGYFAPFVYTKNVQNGNSGVAGSYPANNFFPANIGAIGFVNLAEGDYRLGASSPYRNAGTDGKDIGADIPAVNAATAGAVSGVGGAPSPPPTAPSLVTVR